MNRNFILVLSVLLLSLCKATLAEELPGRGITFPVTRIIYPESESGGISFTVTNNTDNLYLLQSRVVSDRKEETDGGKVPFIVIPPLTRFEPGASVTLLIRQSGKITPTDRESLWRLALKTIPAQSDDSRRGEIQEGTLVVALQNNLRLFYRPSGLPVLSEEERAGKLIFAAEGSMLRVSNPSSYYVTLSELFADELPVNTGEDKTIAPHGIVRYATGSRLIRGVSWSVAGDHGGATERHERSLH